MIRSMTAFASQTGTNGAASWIWDIRSVNGRGLDLRLRLPDRVSSIEGDLRKAVSNAVTRGNVTIGLKLSTQSEDAAWSLDHAQLTRVLAALAEVENAAADAGLGLRAPTSAEVLSTRGVIAFAGDDDSLDPEAMAAIRRAFDTALAEFVGMREGEGRALADLLLGHLRKIEALVADAVAASQGRAVRSRDGLQRALDRLKAEGAPVAEERLAQELALLAVKADVTEELDRLGAHIAAARDLLSKGGAVGRKLDFLSQEFNREANTLCAKSLDPDLTAIGLDLKAVIDQMREQIQNVE